MNPNKRGEIALVKVIADLTEKGYSIFLPVADYLPIDLIVVNEKMIPRRIQVKYRSLNGVNRINVPLSSVVNGKRVAVDLTCIDGYAIYVPDNDKLYYLSLREIPSEHTIWLKPDTVLLDETVFWK